jgi:hypothetical protein
MKLTKDQIQKIVLGGMIFCGVIYSYFAFLLGPLSAGREQALKDTQEIGPKIAAARAQIAKTKGIEEKAPASLRTIEQVQAMIPQGSPIAWVPTKIADLFKREGVEKVSARMAGELPEKELTGFGRYSWSVEVPHVEFITFGRALSALENDEPLMEIQSLEVDAGHDDVQFQRTSITLQNIVRQ